MHDLKDIIFAPISLSLSDQEIDSINEEHQNENLVSFYSQYRTCRMIPIRTTLGSSDPQTISNKSLKHEWTENIQYMPKTRNILEEKFLPIVGGDCRIITLCTPPNSKVKVHYDCSEDTFHEVQLKMRLVLKGDLDSLWFLGEKNEKVYNTCKSPLYLLSGSHPHGVTNKSNKEKMTLCLGGRFQGSEETIQKLLNESYQSSKKDWLTHKELPQKFIPELFQKNYEKYLKEETKDDRLGIDP